MENKWWICDLQGIYDSIEEFEKYDANYGIMLTLNEERLNLGLDVYESLAECWEDNPTLTGTDDRNDLTIIVDGKKPKQWVSE